MNKTIEVLKEAIQVTVLSFTKELIFDLQNEVLEGYADDAKHTVRKDTADVLTKFTVFQRNNIDKSLFKFEINFDRFRFTARISNTNAGGLTAKEKANMYYLLSIAEEEIEKFNNL